MSKLILCIEMENWEKAEMFAESYACAEMEEIPVTIIASEASFLNSFAFILLLNESVE